MPLFDADHDDAFERSREDRERARAERERLRAEREQLQAARSDPGPVLEPEPEPSPASARPFGVRPPPLPGEKRRRRAPRHAQPGHRSLRDALLHRHSSLARERRRAQRERPRPRWLARVLAGVTVAFLAFVAWFAISLWQPFHGSPYGRVVVVIPPGSSSSKIGSILTRDHVVPSGFFFRLRTVLDGKRSDLRSGTFVMQHGMTYGAAIAELTRTPPPVTAVNVVVPEGDARTEIAQIAHADGLRGSYLAASLSSPLLKPTHYGAPADTRSLEGFLFPASYDLRSGTTAAQLVAAQLRSFHKQLGPAFVDAARRRHETPYQALTVASMVEREAATARDRPLVAAVIYNRLRLGMPLGIDSTLRYALDDWTQPLTASQLALDSPYNTRTHRGLPPTPIGNPGLASVDAALNPAHVDYLYFVVKPCGNGEQVFTASYAQFLRDSASYQAARAARGGRSPENCTP